MHNKVLSIRNLSKDLLIDEEESNSRQPPVASESHPTLSGESANSRVPDATSGIFSRPQTRSTCTYTESNFVPTPLTELVCPVTPSTHILSAHLASTPGSVGRDQFPIGLRVGKDRSPKETPRDFHGRLKVGMLLPSFNDNCNVMCCSDGRAYYFFLLSQWQL